MSGRSGAHADPRRLGGRAGQFRGVHRHRALRSRTVHPDQGQPGFRVFEAGMPLIGLLAGRDVAHTLGDAARYAGGALLVAIGAWQLIQTARLSKKGVRAPPIGTSRLILTALALSMDNLVVGFGLGVEHVSVVAALAVFAAVSVVLSLLGLEFGRRFAAVVEVGSQYLAGAVLVAVGILVAVGEL